MLTGTDNSTRISLADTPSLLLCLFRDMAFQFNNPLPRSDLPIAQEVSRLDSPRESSSIFHGWKRERSSINRGEALTSGMSQLQRQISKIKKVQYPYSDMHPFKIYQFPSWLRQFQPPDAWKRVMVRSGGVDIGNGTYPAAGILNQTPVPYGCDLFSAGLAYNNLSQLLFGGVDTEQFLNNGQTPPKDGTAFQSLGGLGEIIIPDDGNKCAIWISMCGLAQGTDVYPVILYGESPTSCTSLWDGTVGADPWPGFPDNDPYHFLIGYAWTNRGYGIPSYNKGITIQQVLFTNVQTNISGSTSAGGQGTVGVRFKGEYSAVTYYWAGDEVTKTGTDFTQKYLLFPKDPGHGGSHWFGTGPVLNLDPATNSPDPWLLVGNFPNVTTEIWATGAYDSSKFYLRKV